MEKKPKTVLYVALEEHRFLNDDAARRRDKLAKKCGIADLEYTEGETKRLRRQLITSPILRASEAESLGKIIDRFQKGEMRIRGSENERYREEFASLYNGSIKELNLNCLTYDIDFRKLAGINKKMGELNRLREEERAKTITERVKSGEYSGNVYVEAGIAHTGLYHELKRLLKGNRNVEVRQVFLTRGKDDKVRQRFTPMNQLIRIYRFGVNKRYNKREMSEIADSLMRFEYAFREISKNKFNMRISEMPQHEIKKLKSAEEQGNKRPIEKIGYEVVDRELKEHGKNYGYAVTRDAIMARRGIGAGNGMQQIKYSRQRPKPRKRR